jgi:diaminopimelate epimerase
VTALRFVKGHGTENDFLLLPDPDGELDLDEQLVRALCDRRAGLGADGVVRVVRSAACDDPAAVAARGRAEWFMDYRNADGSLSEMCGNGVRVLARYLLDREGATSPLLVGTRAGVRRLVADDGLVTVDMGPPALRGTTEVGVEGGTWPATHVSMGNPHAVAFVDDLADAGPLCAPPEHDQRVYPDGVNVEFVVRRGPGHVAMRVHERGSGETRSCGTGACAAAVAAAVADGAGPGAAYRVDVPGGTVTVTWTDDGTQAGAVLLTGPALLVAEGYWLASG